MLMAIAECRVLYVRDIGQMEKADALAVLKMVIIQSRARYIIAAWIRNLYIVEIVKVFPVYG